METEEGEVTRDYFDMINEYSPHSYTWKQLKSKQNDVLNIKCKLQFSDLTLKGVRVEFLLLFNKEKARVSSDKVF